MKTCGEVEVWLHHSCTRRWLSFTRLLLYFRGKDILYPLERGPDGPQSRPGLCEEKKNFAPVGNRTPVSLPVARRYTH
jgi:hypothetical protein